MKRLRSFAALEKVRDAPGSTDHFEIEGKLRGGRFW
jgi:hypothetical protein